MQRCRNIGAGRGPLLPPQSPTRSFGGRASGRGTTYAHARGRNPGIPSVRRRNNAHKVSVLVRETQAGSTEFGGGCRIMRVRGASLVRQQERRQVRGLGWRRARASTPEAESPRAPRRRARWPPVLPTPTRARRNLRAVSPTQHPSDPRARGIFTPQQSKPGFLDNRLARVQRKLSARLCGGLSSPTPARLLANSQKQLALVISIASWKQANIVSMYNAISFPLEAQRARASSPGFLDGRQISI
ncbi:hypothetical protein HJG60_009426 [Phyllostomus discolor]|uniref:Uncharacterized protein n=1 Tax=Phyllostomus discolor TaxID=89673 RepID=A0A834D8W9_9CHIR|nr:hypothetical protein HJG60_009426 [Phyllostomus discolor]